MVAFLAADVRGKAWLDDDAARMGELRVVAVAAGEAVMIRWDDVGL